MSDGTPKPATWPMWRGPFAYGHATATRIFCGVVDIGAHDTSGLRPGLGVSPCACTPPAADRQDDEKGCRRRGCGGDERARAPTIALLRVSCRARMRGGSRGPV